MIFVYLRDFYTDFSPLLFKDYAPFSRRKLVPFLEKAGVRGIGCDDRTGEWI
jgi:hypothetical protein